MPEKDVGECIRDYYINWSCDCFCIYEKLCVSSGKSSISVSAVIIELTHKIREKEFTLFK